LHEKQYACDQLQLHHKRCCNAQTPLQQKQWLISMLTVTTKIAFRRWRFAFADVNSLSPTRYALSEAHRHHSPWSKWIAFIDSQKEAQKSRALKSVHHIPHQENFPTILLSYLRQRTWSGEKCLSRRGLASWGVSPNSDCQRHQCPARGIKVTREY
jgi:hypothetical protein